MGVNPSTTEVHEDLGQLVPRDGKYWAKRPDGHEEPFECPSQALRYLHDEAAKAERRAELQAGFRG